MSSGLGVTGDWDGNIFGWKIQEILEQDSSLKLEDRQQSKKKKKSGAGLPVTAQVMHLSSSFNVHGHSQAISGLNIVDSGRRAFTCSYDHSVKVWDLERQDCVLTLAGPKACTSLTYSMQSCLVATSHPDGKVRLWDTRQTECASHAGAYGKGKQWVSQTKWCPNSDKYFASVDYEGVVSLWDIRADSPLAAAEAHDGKGLCLDWIPSTGNSTARLVTGGSDCMLHVSDISF